MIRIDTKRARDSLPPRREPYWYKLSRGCFLGLRKLKAGHAAWIARYCSDQYSQKYQALGEYTAEFTFDAAKRAAEQWFGDIERGVRSRNDDGTPFTVAAACAAYVESLCTDDRRATARDAHMRFRRTVYGAEYDSRLLPLTCEGGVFVRDVARAHRGLGRPLIRQVAHLPLAKVLAPHIREWHAELVANGAARSSANRTLSSLKAALNFAVLNRKVGANQAQEWAEAAPFKELSHRRDLFLDLKERSALLQHAVGPVGDLIEGAALTGCRPGELVNARRSQFEPRTRSLTVTGKTGTRTIPLPPQAHELFLRLSRDKLPAAYLFTREGGERWRHSDWDELVKAAAKAAELSPTTCLYTLRHSFITQALLDGVSTLEVAKFVGTSLAMIEKHYGHLVESTVRERMARIRFV